MKNFSYSGKSITFTAKEAVASGHGYILNDAFGVTAGALTPGQSGELFIRGAFTLPKDPSKVILTGQKVYWDSEASVVFLAEAEEIKKRKGRLIGLAGEDADSGSESLLTILNGVDC
jgi:predicted RecA/RadA family phage recombinase